jgi:hypothetical protein
MLARDPSNIFFSPHRDSLLDTFCAVSISTNCRKSGGVCGGNTVTSFVQPWSPFPLPLSMRRGSL